MCLPLRMAIELIIQPPSMTFPAVARPWLIALPWRCCAGQAKVGEQKFKAVAPEDIYLSRLLLLQQDSDMTGTEGRVYYTQESHDFYPQCDMLTPSETDDIPFRNTLSRLCFQAHKLLLPERNVQDLIFHALLPPSGSGERGKSQAVLLFKDFEVSPKVLAMSKTERAALMKQILAVRIFYVEEKASAPASASTLQLCESGALAGSLCELEMSKRDRRWYLEVRTDVALPNIETQLDCGLGIDTGDEFRAFVAKAQKFPTVGPLPTNRCILGVGFKGGVLPALQQ